MISKEHNWKIGETVILPRTETLLKKEGTKTYERIVGSQYICVREETERQRGILVKLLEKTSKEQIMFVNGEPFCEDEQEGNSDSKRYLGYPFPTSKGLIEVLEIISQNQGLMDKLKETSPQFNPYSTFWVNETVKHLLLLKRPQYYDAYSDHFHSVMDDKKHNRLTIVYFYKNNLIW